MHIIILLAMAIVLLAADPAGAQQGVGSTYEGCESLQELGVSWFYNWGTHPPLCEGVEAVPMVWGREQTGLPVGGNSEWLLGWNEPDNFWQSWVLPFEGAALWKVVEKSYPDKKLVSPAVMSIGWLERWHAEYVFLWGEPPRLDALAIHCYVWNLDAVEAAEYCKGQVRRAEALAAEWDVLEVWLTEYAFLCDPMEGMRYMSMMRLWLGSRRHAWFQRSYKGTEPWAFGSDCNTSLVDYQTGGLTAYGEAYIRPIYQVFLPFGGTK